MAEIRVRDAHPELIKQLEAIALELKEATITGCLLKLIPRYHDMKKRIVEQNVETGKLVQELRAAQNRVANAGTELTDYHEDVTRAIRFLQEHEKAISKRTQTFLSGKKSGTKKKPAGPAGRTRKSKIVPKKKAPSTVKRKK